MAYSFNFNYSKYCGNLWVIYCG